MKQIDFHDNHFNSIQVLRAVSAIFVILEHVRFLNCGAFGVDIFFCISGFMIMFSTHKSTKHFIGKRAIRILPLYYTMTAGTFLLLLLFPSMFEQTTANFSYLVKSLLFIPFDIGGGILQPLMRIGWTINCEIFFYLLFFVSFRINHKYRGLLCSIFLGLLVILNYALPHQFAPLQFYGDPVMLDFILGILCYYVAQGIYAFYRKHSESKWILYLSTFGLLSAINIFETLVRTKPTINILGFGRPLLWGTSAFALVLCFFVAGLYYEMPRVLVFIGNMSFSIYLIHYYPVMLLDRMIFDFSAYSPFAVFGVIISVIICLGCSAVCWHLFEKQLTKWLQKRLLQ